MRTSEFTPEQMVHILHQGDSGVPVVELCMPRDFEKLTDETGMEIKRRVVLSGSGEAEGGPAKALPNLPAQGAVNALSG